MLDDYVPSKRSKFMYFAYGSNLWTNRIRLQNASAVRKGIAELKVILISIAKLILLSIEIIGYRLDFYKPKDEPSIWNGSSATIKEDDNHSVWGAVWEIDLTHLASLDCQEGVHIDIYVPLIKDVHTPDGEVIECRTYQMVKAPTNAIDLHSPEIPIERKPSKTYLTVINRGAEESGLPEKYRTFLEKIVHNDCEAHPDLVQKLFPENEA